MTTATKLATTNPYVGPSTFQIGDRDRYFGREREAAALLARVVSERLLLFYAQSGAGKSSLINARLIPQLEEQEYFAVLPVGRVGGALPAGVPADTNPFLYNLMASLDRSEQPAWPVDITLSAFLDGLVTENGRDWYYKASAGSDDATQADDLAAEPDVEADADLLPRFALIIDQFEEIISEPGTVRSQRERFFRQLDRALRDHPNLWVVLSLRDDFVAALDPYAPLVFNRLRARFQMERMQTAAAKEAIRRPAALGGHPFDVEAANVLLRDLSLVRVAGQEERMAGDSIEPVQLQVVCFQLWQEVAGREIGTPITLDDVRAYGDVDRALTNYYEESLVLALDDDGETVTNEHQLRSWFDERLITETGTRGLVQRESAGLPDSVLKELEARFLLRTETRGGAIWLELTHDRFVEPIQSSNRDWFIRNQNPLKHAVITRRSKSVPLPLLTASTNPWLGVRAYDSAHGELFFGRDADISALSALVNSNALTLIVGAAGSGKSSLVNAGLLPHLARDVVNRWRILPPMRPHGRPFATLADLLTNHLPEAAEYAVDANPTRGMFPYEELRLQIAGWQQDHPDQRLVLVVDQLEELVTVCSEKEKRRFLELLEELILSEPHTLRLICILRLGFVDAIFPKYKVPKFELSSLNHSGLRQVIAGPASQRFLYFDPPELIDTLASEALHLPGALSLLSHTLSEMYLNHLGRETNNRALTQEDYDQVGGIRGSLINRAEEIYETLPADAQETMRRVMLRMISPDGDALTPRRVRRAELVYAKVTENTRVAEVLDLLVGARLLTIGHEDGELFVEAPELLLGTWGRLLEWKQSAESYLPLQHRLSEAANDWQQAPQSFQPGLLWDANPRLNEIESILWPGHSNQLGLERISRMLFPTIEPQVEDHWLNAMELSFIEDTVRRRSKFFRRLSALVLMGFAILTALVLVSNTQRVAASKAEAAAREESIRSLSSRLAAEALVHEEESPIMSLLLAVEAVNIGPTDSAENVLRRLATSVGGIPLSSHEGPVSAIAFSPDGSWFATGSWDATTRLWDSEGALISVLEGSEDVVTSIAVSPDGSRIATASWDKTARLWDSEGNELAVLVGHTAGVDTVVFSPDGSRILTTSWDGTARLWDSDGNEVAVLFGHTDRVNSVAFSPDGQLIATASQDGTARIWGLPTYEEDILLAAHTDALTDVAFRPDGKQVATSSWDGTIRLWNLDDGDSEGLVVHTQEWPVLAVGYSSDATYVVIPGNTSSVAAILRPSDGSTPEEIQDENQPVGSEVSFVSQVQLSADGSWLASLQDESKTIELWNVTNPSQTSDAITLRGHESTISEFLLSPNSRQLVSVDEDGVIRLWDIDQLLYQLPAEWEMPDIIAHACDVAGRNLTEQEWSAFLEDVPYRKTCEGY